MNGSAARGRRILAFKNVMYFLSPPKTQAEGRMLQAGHGEQVHVRACEQPETF